MFTSFLALPAPVGIASVFLAGGAAGIALSRFTQGPLAGSTTEVSDDSDRSLRAQPRTPDLARAYGSRVVDSATVPPRARTGRLPLPQDVTDLTPADEPSLALVNCFVDRLAALPIQDWFEIGRGQIAGPASSQHTTAFAILEATIASQGLGLAAWYARDAVETSAFIASNSVHRWTATNRRVFAAAHGAAEDAALALLARNRLAPSDFALLFEAFEGKCPAAELTGLEAP